MNLHALKMRRKLRLKSMTEINVINLVDVMLTLLIIFILVAPAIKQGIDLNLPKATQAEAVEKESVLIEMNKQGSLYIANRRIKLDDLGTELAIRHEKNPGEGVLLRADEVVEYGKVVEILDLIRAAGIERVGILTREVTEREFN